MAYEDFTTYTEVDSPDQLTVTSSKVTSVGVVRTSAHYIYRDKGVAHFSGDYEHLLIVYIDSTGTNPSWVAGWSLFNGIGDTYALRTGDGHKILPYRAAAGVIYLQELFAGTDYSASYACSFDTIYYLKVKRVESVGTYGTLYLYIYSDAARTNLLQTLSLALHEKEDFRYIYASQNHADGTGGMSYKGYTENLDLQEAAAGASIPVFMNLQRQWRT